MRAIYANPPICRRRVLFLQGFRARADRELPTTGENPANPLAGPPVRRSLQAGDAKVLLIRHGPLSLRLQLRARQLRQLLDARTFWARGRSLHDLRRMLLGSAAVVSAWEGDHLVGFGRATSDGVFRAVLWDVVVAEQCEGYGLGRCIVEELLASSAVAKAERVYLMTTNSTGFYLKLGFSQSHGQQLLVRSIST